MNRSLDELNATELNAAIDDTNFPKAQSTQCLSRTSDDPRSPTIANTHQNGNSTPIATPATDDTTQGNGITDATATDRTKDDQSNENGAAQNGHKGFMKRVHPAPLKMVAFKGDSIDIPGTPRTPRTSTTPGEGTCILQCMEWCCMHRVIALQVCI